ncbi:Intraflagellar transport protein 88 [Rhizophlyctis rosea]|nr:Intraflagellar transport protein 88 [Rhizophlyctis rosea]
MELGLDRPAVAESNETLARVPIGDGDDDDDDLYSFDKKPAGIYDGFSTSAGRAIPTQAGYGLRTGFRTATGTAYGDPNAGGRPMTSVRAAGYSSRGRPGMVAGSAPDEHLKTLEKKIQELITESPVLSSPRHNNPHLALEKAKEAAKKERLLAKQREQYLASTAGPAGADAPSAAAAANLDLTYCVLLNLADQYHKNKMYQEALNGYAVIVKNKMFHQSGRLRVNMGNIYFEMGKYGQAVKMYRMALDQITNVNRDIR